MFDLTREWAATYRTTEKNIGIPYYQIREALAALPGMIMESNCGQPSVTDKYASCAVGGFIRCKENGKAFDILGGP